MPEAGARPGNERRKSRCLVRVKVSFGVKGSACPATKENDEQTSSTIFKGVVNVWP